MPAVREQGTAQGEHGSCAGSTPAHARLLHALLDHDLAGRFHRATPDGIAGLAEAAIAHASTVGEAIAHRLTQALGPRCSPGILGAPHTPPGAASPGADAPSGATQVAALSLLKQSFASVHRRSTAGRPSRVALRWAKQMHSHPDHLLRPLQPAPAGSRPQGMTNASRRAVAGTIAVAGALHCRIGPTRRHRLGGRDTHHRPVRLSPARRLPPRRLRTGADAPGFVLLWSARPRRVPLLCATAVGCSRRG